MSGQDIGGLVYLALCAVIFLYWIWGKITGRKIDNSEAWERKYPKRPELRRLPYRFSWWHVPVFLIQAAFVGWWIYMAALDGQNIAAILFLAIVLCAFLTACIAQTTDWVIQRLRRLRRHGGQSSGDSLSLPASRPGISQSTEQRQRIGIRN